MGLLANKVALITGAARGMGRAHAVTSAREGADVILFDVPPRFELIYPLASSEDLHETARLVEKEGQRALVIEGDVRTQADLDRAVALGTEELGPIDILIANAGVWTSANFWELTEEQWSVTMEVNLGGVWRACKAVAPQMIERQTGSIVLVSSINGFEGGPTYGHYSASKHGVLGLMKSYAVELGGHGIRVNALCPGPTWTQMVDHQGAWDLFAGHPGGTQENMIEAGYAFLGLKGFNWIEPQSQADAALFLNSDLAKAITGATLQVDAGHLVLPGHNHAPVRAEQP